MPDRPRVRLPLGGGLDRGTGPTVTEPTSFADLRNVSLTRGRMALRRGLAQTAAFALEDAILEIAPIRSQGIGAVLTWRAATREVRLWQVADDATGPTLIGVVWTLPAGYAGLPRIITADSYDKLFIAHDEPVFAFRQLTQVYDPYGLTPIAPLTADLDGDGTAAEVRFRGVVQYLNYVVGWGYGSEAEPDRPEIVRVCVAGDPLSWLPAHYFIAGQRGDPVVGCNGAGNILAVQKQSQSYQIVGSSPLDFGIRVLTPRFGRLAGRLAVTVGGALYYWSNEGPRTLSGDGDQDLALPLDLDGAQVDAALANLDTDNGFAAYLPVQREVWFVFGRWAFVLHVADNAPRWSYHEFSVPIQCGDVLYEQVSGRSAPEVHYEYVATVTHLPTEIDATFNWVGTWHIEFGDETEYYGKPASTGTWVKLGHDAPASDAPTNPSTLHFTGLLPGMHYELAARVARSGVGAAGYAGGNPDLWAANAQTGTQDTTTPTPTIDSALWSPVSRTTLTLDPTDPNEAWFGIEAEARANLLHVVPEDVGTVTATRASAARYYDENGVLQTAAVNEIRSGHYAAGVRSILLEGSGANALTTYSTDVSQAAWTRSNLTAAMTATGPDRVANSACRLTESAVSGFHYCQRTITIVAGQSVAMRVWWRPQGRQGISFQIRNVSAADRVSVVYDAATGTLTTPPFGAGTFTMPPRIIHGADGWLCFEFAGIVNGTDTTIQLFAGMQLSDTGWNYLGDGVSGCDLYNLQAETARRAPSSDMPSDAAAGTRANDIVGWPMPGAPAASQWDITFIERGAAVGAGLGVAYLGNDAATGARLWMQTTGTGYSFCHHNGTTQVSSAVALTPNIGDTVALRGVLNANGSVQLFMSVNGAAEVAGAVSAANALAGAWSDTTFRLNSLGTANQGKASYLQALVGGVWVGLTRTALDIADREAEFDTSALSGPTGFHARLNSTYVGAGAWSAPFYSNPSPPPAPAITEFRWSRVDATHEQAVLTLDATALAAAVTYEAEISTDGGTTWLPLTATAQTPASRQLTVDLTGYGEATVKKLHVRQRADDRPVNPSAWGASADEWVGPPPPSSVVISKGAHAVGDGDYDVDWLAGSAGDSNDVEGRDAAAGWSGAYTTVVEMLSAVVNVPCPVTNVQARVRTRQTAFGVDDFSEWVESATIGGSC